MKKFASLVALALMPVLGVMVSAPVFADSPGQLSNGPANYKVRNVTKNTAYAQSVDATCNETVKYSITLSNSDYGLLTNLMVKANIGSGAINASATNTANETTAVSGTATVNVDKGTLAYVPGSTVRITSDGKSTVPLADGIVSGGVNAGNLNGSTAIFVQFQAKVNCPTPEVKYIKVCELATKDIITIDEKAFDATKHSKNLEDCAAKPPVKGEIVVCEIATKKVITIKEDQFDASKHTKDLSKCAAAPVVPVMPTELPQTGATGVIGVVASVIAAAAGYVVTARKNLLG
ncbi:MAG: hypothetical protein WBK76_04475 [Candidatus Saccharimonadales bacterium]